MIKSTATKSKPTEFPRLMTSDDGVVVLMSSHGKGVIIHVGDGVNYLGEYSARWDMSNFFPYDGMVTLT